MSSSGQSSLLGGSLLGFRFFDVDPPHIHWKHPHHRPPCPRDLTRLFGNMSKSYPKNPYSMKSPTLHRIWYAQLVSSQTFRWITLQKREKVKKRSMSHNTSRVYDICSRGNIRIPLWYKKLRRIYHTLGTSRIVVSVMSFGPYVFALSSLRYEILFHTVLSVIRFPYTSLSCTRSARVLARDSISVDEECLSGINYCRLRENNFTFSGSLQSSWKSVRKTTNLTKNMQILQKFTKNRENFDEILQNFLDLKRCKGMQIL